MAKMTNGKIGKNPKPVGPGKGGGKTLKIGSGNKKSAPLKGK